MNISVLPVVQHWIDESDGWLGTDAYSTAWVAMVPALNNPNVPAWTSALDYLRRNQLSDGGWGEARVYYAHERTINTLAAILALHQWGTSSKDQFAIRRGLRALRTYAKELAEEPCETIGFELLLPRLRDELTPTYRSELPLDKWQRIDGMHQEKLKLIKSLKPDPNKPHTWWFSMEALPAEALADVDDSLLDANGSIATSTASTAAYLAARRRAGSDSPRAAEYLNSLLEKGEGGVPVGWPFEVYERVWILDSFMRAGLDPRASGIAEIVDLVQGSWERNQQGLAYSDVFRVNDGDNTMVGFAVLNWAGLAPSDEPLFNFWTGDHFRTYPDERSTSVSVNIHGLLALRTQPGFPHRDLAEKVTAWLRQHISAESLFDDKWHLSPYYSIAHAIPAFSGWDNEVALRCARFLAEQQHSNGGWGWFSTTAEETAHCVLGLYAVHKAGLLDMSAVLNKAGDYFSQNNHEPPYERLWIGKTVHSTDGITKATVFAAKQALRQCGYL